MTTISEVNGPISLAAYAKHRGVSPPAVTKAVHRGRLTKSIVRVDGQPKIRDIALADLEWIQNTSRKPGSPPTGQTAAPPAALRLCTTFAVCRVGLNIAIVRLESSSAHAVEAPNDFIDGAIAATDPESAVEANRRAFPHDTLLFEEMTLQTARELARLLTILVGAPK